VAGSSTTTMLLVTACCLQRRNFHDFFVTLLPSSSLRPDSRLGSGPHHKLPRAESTPHPSANSVISPAAPPPPPIGGYSRELTVVRIPLRSAKHHFGVCAARGTRPYNEDHYQAGTIEVPAFAKSAPISLSRRNAPQPGEDVGGTAADSASGDPQVFYFGVFDGHGGDICSKFLKDELHDYVEKAVGDFEIQSTLRKRGERVAGVATNNQANLPAATTNSTAEAESEIDEVLDQQPDLSAKGEEEDQVVNKEPPPAIDGQDPEPSKGNQLKAINLQKQLIRAWKNTVGGYFRRFKPEYFGASQGNGSMTLSSKATENTVLSIESTLMYAFLQADLDFVSAQAAKPHPDAAQKSEVPLDNDRILGRSPLSAKHQRIGGPERFVGGSTASVAMISTPTPTPFWHPASPSTIMVAHVGDTRILLCETATGRPVPLTTNHRPSAPIEGSRLRRYAATFVTDSFGEERMSGLANTRAFGDMRSKRIGVSAEPELTRLEMGPAQYSFLVLISDGVSGTLSDQEIVDIVKEAKTPDQGAGDVVAFATEVTRDGDNATCLVVRLGGWERRNEGGLGSMGTKEARDWRQSEAGNPRGRTA
jgi:protein phosphatase PTC6